MCGIVGYIGHAEAGEILLKGMKRLEYRGYDSAGVAIDEGNNIVIRKKKGRIKELEQEVIPKGHVGIGHTRWATHGKPSDENSHPFFDCNESIAIVHNGIIDNFVSLKESLLEEGHTFRSQTDSEVIAHLIESNYQGDLLEAVKKTVSKIKGSYAIVVIHKDEDYMVVARNQSPLVIGVGTDENMVASDVPAILDRTNEVIYLMDGDTAKISSDDIEIWDGSGDSIDREAKFISWTVEDAEKGGYDHFMLKEIYEQPKAIHDSILGRLGEFKDVDLSKYNIDMIKIISCGTSYHAGLVGKYIIEEISGIPCMTDLASEYRYSSPPDIYPFTILISQSGETADTLAAAKEARRRGCKTLAITNVLDSSITREVDEVVYTHAGPEIGVAATKTFTTQLIVLYLIAIQLGLKKGKLLVEEADDHRNQLRRLPRKVEILLNDTEHIKEISRNILARAEDIFFVGRNINYPVALEGALKLKEIAYIHAAGYPAGELKHGPFALLTKNTPVVGICIKDKTYEKMIGNIGEIAARESPIIGVAEDTELEKLCDEIVGIPEVPPLFSPVLVNVVLQLFAYYTAYELGCSIDKPRNLAKSVTVE